MKVLVYGTGFAGQGHCDAFRTAGAEVVGIVGRTESVVLEVAAKKNIPYAGTNWTAALTYCQPDIVSIATPGGAHFDVCMEAMAQGCHVFCDKPLAESAEHTIEMHRKSVEMGVKTAFASSFRYMPEVMHAKQLVESGAIGELLEAECISHFGLDPAIPLGWSHRLSQGGGRLNNNFTHLMSIATYVIGERILSVQGQVRNDMPRAPIVEGVHNFTERRNFIPEDLNDPELKWGDADAEWSYTVMAKLESATPAAQPVSVLFKHGGITPRFQDDHLVFYGSEGAIFIKGNYGKGPLYLCKSGGEWQEIETPKQITASLPDIEDDTQRSWTYLAQMLVDDANGKTVEPYQGFEIGSRYQEIIEAIRAEKLWIG